MTSSVDGTLSKIVKIQTSVVASNVVRKFFELQMKLKAFEK
jgi:hypothetical protein